MREINRDMIRELVGNHILPLYFCIKETGGVELTLSKMEADRYIAHTWRSAGYTVQQICDGLELKKRQVKCLLGRKLTKGFREATQLIGNPLVLMRKSDEYAFDYRITLKVVERMIIEDLAKAGWGTTQIKKATGFNLRTIQRIRKEQGVSYEQ